MKRKGLRYVLYVILLLCLGFVVLNLLAYSHAWKMTHFTEGGPSTDKPETLSILNKTRILLTGVNMPRPCDNRPPSELAPDCKAISIDAPDNITLAAWYCDRGESVPLVVLFHGYGTDKTALLDEAKAFLELGTSVLLVDFRGSGGSSESYTTIGMKEADDVAAVVRYAEHDLHHSSLILFGQSMGAAAILKAVDEHELKADGLILEAVFDTMLNTVRNRFQAMKVPSFPSAQFLVFWGGRLHGCNAFKNNPLDYASAVHCPALFMHGTDDPRARLQESKRVYDATRGPKTFKEFSSTGHEAYVTKYPGEWKHTVAEFLAKVNQP